MSIRSGHFASRMAATFSPFQRSPELRVAMARVALSKTREISLSLNHSDRFHEGEMRSLLKDLDNTVTALPHELRIRIGGYAPLHQLDSDEAIESWMRARLVKQEEVLTQWLREIDPLFASPAQKCTGDGKLSASARRSPQKETIQQSKQARSIPSKTQIGAGIGEGIEGMSALRKRILGVGLLLICVGSMIEASDSYNGSPSLGWMVAMGATWALVVWLFPPDFLTKFHRFQKKRIADKKRKRRKRIVVLKRQSFITDQEIQAMLLTAKDGSIWHLENDLTASWRKLSLKALDALAEVLDEAKAMHCKHVRLLEKVIQQGLIPEWWLDRAAEIVFKKEGRKWRELSWGKLRDLPGMWQEAKAKGSPSRS